MSRWFRGSVRQVPILANSAFRAGHDGPASTTNLNRGCQAGRVDRDSPRMGNYPPRLVAMPIAGAGAAVDGAENVVVVGYGEGTVVEAQQLRLPHGSRIERPGLVGSRS